MSKPVKEFKKEKSKFIQFISKNKTILIVIMTVLIIAAFVFVYADSRTAQEPPQEISKSKAVTVMTVDNEAKRSSISYLGVIQPEVVIEKTFSTFMTVEEVYVKEGQAVDIGDPLMSLDTTTLEDELTEQGYAVRSARKQLESAEEALDAANLRLAAAQSTSSQEDIDAAEEALVAASLALDAAEAAYIEGQEDFDNGDIDQGTLNDLQREYIIAQANYNAALAQYEAVTSSNAQIDVEIAQAEVSAAQAAYDAAEANYNLQLRIYKNMESVMDDSTIYASMDGYVLSIIFDEGETVNPISPAIVTGSKQMMITIGLSRNDAKTITEDAPVEVIVDDVTYDAHISTISKLPDEQAKTYECNIAFDSGGDGFFIGDIGTVKIFVDTKPGIWIPIAAIMNDGDNYVYLVKAGTAKKRYIDLKEMSNDIVNVGGLSVGEMVVIKGMTAVQDGQAVDVIGEGE